MLRLKRKEKEELEWTDVPSLRARWISPHKAIPQYTLLKARFQVESAAGELSSPFEIFLYKEGGCSWHLLLSTETANAMDQVHHIIPARGYGYFIQDWRFYRRSLPNPMLNPQYYRRDDGSRIDPIPRDHPAMQAGVNLATYSGSAASLQRLGIKNLQLLLPKGFKESVLGK